ncbi:hypothetical protein RRG08_013630 [Elysia crispata]|uniref:Retrotransposon gag domain-containing protein n=1 Tax=Elysia crispata TaxID=231223 RepID=A0AAE1A1S4_9GAST|nr:hypothetical protein RRG08_013630 [Elysia crispata]
MPISMATNDASATTPIPGLRPPDKLSLGSNSKENWRLFYQRWTTYTKMAKMDQQPEDVKEALFLHLLDDDALRTFNSFQFSSLPENRTVQEIIDQFDHFAVGDTNETYERYLFNKRKQEEGEAFDTFLADLRRKIKSCNFCEQCRDSILRVKIIIGIRSAETQTDLLKVRTLDLQKSIDICKAAENAESQNKMMRTGNIENSTVNKISHKRDMSTKRNCRYCGSNHTFANK